MWRQLYNNKWQTQTTPDNPVIKNNFDSRCANQQRRVPIESIALPWGICNWPSTAPILDQIYRQPSASSYKTSWRERVIVCLCVTRPEVHLKDRREQWNEVCVEKMNCLHWRTQTGDLSLRFELRLEDSGILKRVFSSDRDRWVSLIKG